MRSIGPVELVLLVAFLMLVTLTWGPLTRYFSRRKPPRE
jgi:hypothetical protein